MHNNDREAAVGKENLRYVSPAMLIKYVKEKIVQVKVKYRDIIHEII